jgi:hypothetical protein
VIKATMFIAFLLVSFVKKLQKEMINKTFLFFKLD